MEGRCLGGTVHLCRGKMELSMILHSTCVISVQLQAHYYAAHQYSVCVCTCKPIADGLCSVSDTCPDEG